MMTLAMIGIEGAIRQKASKPTDTSSSTF